MTSRTSERSRPVGPPAPEPPVRPEFDREGLDRRSHLSPRRVTRLLLTRPDALSDSQRSLLSQLTGACPEMTSLAILVRSFAALLSPDPANEARLCATEPNDLQSPLGAAGWGWLSLGDGRVSADAAGGLVGMTTFAVAGLLLDFDVPSCFGYLFQVGSAGR